MQPKIFIGKSKCMREVGKKKVFKTFMGFKNLKLYWPILLILVRDNFIND